jgi:hypothetical protein
MSGVSLKVTSYAVVILRDFSFEKSGAHHHERGLAANALHDIIKYVLPSRP